jgi:transposase
MSLRAQPIPPVPEETVRGARAAFPAGNPSLRLRDEFGAIFADGDFADRFPTRGQPAAAPWQLALITRFHFVADLSDRQAADAVRARLEWQDALSLDRTHPGFDHTVLSEFRGRLVAGEAAGVLLDRLLARCQERTHLGHVLTAAALNFARVAAWLAEVPRARTRRSAFATLMARAALPTAS